MSACTTSLSPPYGVYVRLLFAKGQSVERDLTLSDANQNFRSGGKGRLHYLGWDRKILGAEYARKSKYSSQGRSWPTGIPYAAPNKFEGQLVLGATEWNALNDIFLLQQDSMKPGRPEQDLLVYDHRIMHREPTPVLRPMFDSNNAIAITGIYQYWAVFRTEITKLDLIGMSQKPMDGNYQYLVDLELQERMPALSALP
jgi:hypothetical protein